MRVYEAFLKKHSSSTDEKRIVILAISIREASDKAMKYSKKEYFNQIVSVRFVDSVDMR